MAVPVVDSFSPARGHTGGQVFVAFIGSGFRLPVATTGFPRPPMAPSIRITFGGVEATEVRVEDEETVTCLAPACSLTDAQGVPIPGTVDIVLTHIDEEGDAIPGEAVTLPAAFEYLRPDLGAKSFPMWVLECLFRQLILQVVPRVDWAVHTDYRDSEAIDWERIPECPCLVATDVDFVGSNRGTKGMVEVALPNGRFVQMRAPEIKDCEMSFAGISATLRESINLLVTTDTFFRKNPRLRVPRSIDNADPSAGTMEFDLDVAPLQSMRLTAGGSESNLKTFAKIIAVRGVPFEDIPGAPSESTSAVTAGLAGEAVLGTGYVVDSVDVAYSKKEVAADA